MGEELPGIRLCPRIVTNWYRKDDRLVELFLCSCSLCSSNTQTSSSQEYPHLRNSRIELNNLVVYIQTREKVSTPASVLTLDVQHSFGEFSFVTETALAEFRIPSLIYALSGKCSNNFLRSL